LPSVLQLLLLAKCDYATYSSARLDDERLLRRAQVAQEEQVVHAKLEAKPSQLKLARELQ
jgi:hypothetical protein